MAVETLAQLRLPMRNAAGELRRHVLRYLQSERPQPGSRFMTEAEMVSLMKVSRSTVRRAMDPLEKEGWIDRRAGAGTFVGVRVNDVILNSTFEGAGSDDETQGQLRARRSRGIVRVAVLIFNIGDLAHDWYTPGVLEGMDDAGHDHRVIVELLGDRDSDVDAISRRLKLSRPDVLVVLSNQPRHAFVIRDAQNMGIHCFVSGTPHLGLGVPSVCEDNRQAIRLSLEHLAGKGHRRIALALQRVTEQWAVDRHEAFVEVAASLGLDVDEAMIHWVPRSDAVTGNAESVEAMGRFIEKRQPTALIAGSYLPMLYAERLMRAGRIRIPSDLSLISFEQNLSIDWMGGLKPTYVKFPFKQMGQRLAEMARAVVEKQEIPASTTLPAELIVGETVFDLETKVE